MSKYSVSIRYDADCCDYWIYVNGHCEGFANTHSEAEIKAAHLVGVMMRAEREYSENASASATSANAAIPFLDAIEAQMEPWELAP